jgi:hypothetical protein
MATTPFLKDLPPEIEKVLNDILSMILRNGFRGSTWKVGDLEKFMERIEYDVKTEYKKIQNRIREFSERE